MCSAYVKEGDIRVKLTRKIILVNLGHEKFAKKRGIMLLERGPDGQVTTFKCTKGAKNFATKYFSYIM